MEETLIIKKVTLLLKMTIRFFCTNLDIGLFNPQHVLLQLL
jgi:hypothetical protein